MVQLPSSLGASAWLFNGQVMRGGSLAELVSAAPCDLPLHVVAHVLRQACLSAPPRHCFLPHPPTHAHTKHAACQRGMQAGRAEAGGARCRVPALPAGHPPRHQGGKRAARRTSRLDSESTTQLCRASPATPGPVRHGRGSRLRQRPRPLRAFCGGPSRFVPCSRAGLSRICCACGSRSPTLAPHRGCRSVRRDVIATVRRDVIVP